MQTWSWYHHLPPPPSPKGKTSDLSTHIHLTPLPHPPPLPHKPHELIQHPRPRPILTPPPHPLILQCFRHKTPRLIPHILTNRLLPPRLQILDPPFQPGRLGRGPGEGGGGEEKAPVVDGGVEGEDFGAGEAGEGEGGLVGFAEEGGGGGEGAAEGEGRLVLFGEGVGAGGRG